MLTKLLLPTVSLGSSMTIETCNVRPDYHKKIILRKKMSDGGQLNLLELTNFNKLQYI